MHHFYVQFVGIRMLDGNTTDTIEGSSLSFRNNYIHIYSCAWGPKDDGKRFGRPGTLASKALLLGTKEVSILYENVEVCRAYIRGVTHFGPGPT